MRPRLIVCRVVSLPAVVRRMKNRPNSCSDRREPSISASTSRVVTSSRGSVRRAAPRRQPYSIRSAANGLENGCSRIEGSVAARSRTFSSPTTSGSVLPSSLSPSSIRRRRSSTGQPHDLGEDPHRDLRGDVLDPVEAVALEGLGEDPLREPANALLVGVDDPRREALVDERAQARVGGRIGVEHRLPRLDLLRRQVLERRPTELGRVRLPVLRHLDDVVVAGEDPVPAAVGLGLPEERRLAPQQRQPLVGNALLPDVEVVEVDVVEHEARDGGACRRRGPGDRLGDVVLPLVDRLGGRRRRRQPHLELALLDARLVDRQRLERGRAEDVAGAKVELRTRDRGTRSPGRRARRRRASTPRGCRCPGTRPSRPRCGRGRRRSLPPRRGGGSRRSAPPPHRRCAR